MKIYDCTTFYNEPMMYDLRLNVLDKFVNKFIVAEATYSHSGISKHLNFNINDYPKFKHRINYIVINENPSDLIKIDKNTKKENIFAIKRQNSIKRIELSYNVMQKYLDKAEPEDIIILSDNDEIPNLNQIDFEKTKKNIFIFKQKMFYYKFNLYYDLIPWFGSKACRKKNLISLSWLRNLKTKNYPFWRFDTIFSKTKYTGVKIINDGGWHFTNIKSPKDIREKLLNYGHHDEYELSGPSLNEIEEMIKNKKVYYDHLADKSEKKIRRTGYNLRTVNLLQLPDYLKENFSKYKNWLDLDG